jgi:hypothetical protein
MVVCKRFQEGLGLEALESAVLLQFGEGISVEDEEKTSDMLMYVKHCAVFNTTTMSLLPYDVSVGKALVQSRRSGKYDL